MPIIKSAKKRVKTAAKANIRNNRTRRSMREALKAFNKALESGKTGEIIKAQNQAASAIDRAAKKAVIHKNKASSQKTKLAKQAKAAGVKLTASQKSKVNSPKSKTAAKKAPIRKSVAKKTTKKLV